MIDLKEKKVIFLDIDGVIIPYEYLAYYGHCKKNLAKFVSEFDPSKVMILNLLVDRFPDLVFVISSSHRIIKDLDRLRRDFKAANFSDTSKIVGCTDNNNKLRGEQIRDYVDRENITDYLIIDDDIDVTMRDQPYLRTKAMGGGLTFNHFNQICEYFEEKTRFKSDEEDILVTTSLIKNYSSKPKNTSAFQNRELARKVARL